MSVKRKFPSMTTMELKLKRRAAEITADDLRKIRRSNAVRYIAELRLRALPFSPCGGWLPRKPSEYHSVEHIAMLYLVTA